MAEYALILALVAIVVVVVLAATGQRIAETFCDVVLKIGGKAPSIQVCATPRVTITGIAGGQTVTTWLRVEAVIYDDKGGQDPNIRPVKFYIDGAEVGSENNYHFCMAGDDTLPCNLFDFPALTSGSHVLRVTATDADGNVGEASLTFFR